MRLILEQQIVVKVKISQKLDEVQIDTFKRWIN